jgi:uncharacterized protein
MKTAFIFHGTCGHPLENWFPWMKNELEKIGYKTFVPRFPTPEGQNLGNWLNVFREYEGYTDKDTIFICHSIGCAFGLDILEGLNKKIDKCFLVAGFIGALNLDVDILNKTIAEKEFNWRKIKKNCPRFIMFQSDDDQKVPMEKAEELKEKLDADLIIIKNAGHFNKAAGYTKFEALKEKIIRTQKG